jgi:hypothetical protein
MLDGKLNHGWFSAAPVHQVNDIANNSLQAMIVVIRTPDPPKIRVDNSRPWRLVTRS